MVKAILCEARARRVTVPAGPASKTLETHEDPAHNSEVWSAAWRRGSRMDGQCAEVSQVIKQDSRDTEWEGQPRSYLRD